MPHAFDPGRVLLLGAGPTSLGAAYRFQELGFEDFTILEARDRAGGLASSWEDEAGYTWDLGGHVQFSHYRYYDDVLDRALGADWLWHERESWVWIKGRFVPYPFQNNIHRLDAADRDRALAGLEAVAKKERQPAANFDDLTANTFGEGLCELFLRPYNFKVWGYPLSMLGVEWIGERVALPDLERIRRNIQENRDDVSWGPNNRFRYPLRGGTGAIWRGVAGLLRPGALEYGRAVTRVDLDARVVTMADGERLRYDSLITTIPLDTFAVVADGLSSGTREAAGSLLHSSVHVLGVGLRGPKPDALSKKCWMYFPEGNSPYFRVTILSHYSPHMAPADEGSWSLMAEVCETSHRPISSEGLREWTLRAMREDGLLPPGAELVSFWQTRLEHGYPTPSLQRDEALTAILPKLEEHRVFSRGRFGGWKYEVSNQDHCFMQGVELANRILRGDPEVTYFNPSLANSGVFLKPGA